MKYVYSTIFVFLLVTMWLSSYAESQNYNSKAVKPQPEVKTVVVEKKVEVPVLKKEVTDTFATQQSIVELQKQIVVMNQNLSKLVELNSQLISENSKLKNAVTSVAKGKESPLLSDEVDDKYTWVSDPQTGWPRPTRTVWQRTNVGGAAILECIVRDGKPVPTGAITINGHQGGYTGSNGGGSKGQPISRQRGVQIIRGGR